MQRSDLVEYFRSLDAALNEHKQKGTPQGDTVYQGIHEQLAGDLARFGIGRDQISQVAQECGELSTYKRLEQLMTKQNQPQESEAIALLNEQLNKLIFIRALDFRNPQFISWKNTTTELFQRFFRPEFSHFVTFRDLRFQGQPSVRRIPFGHRGARPTSTISPVDRERFVHGCAVAEECIKAAMEEIRRFGVHTEVSGAKSAQKVGGFHQTFHGPVTILNQATATDNAIQNIEQMGDTGANLQEISELLKQSMELTGRDVVEGLRCIESIATEVQKPEERRDWGSILDFGERLTSIVQKATDVAGKLAPYMPTIATFIGQARHHL